jgi:hypothetical protein
MFKGYEAEFMFYDDGIWAPSGEEPMDLTWDSLKTNYTGLDEIEEMTMQAMVEPHNTLHAMSIALDYASDDAQALWDSFHKDEMRILVRNKATGFEFIYDVETYEYELDRERLAG